MPNVSFDLSLPVQQYIRQYGTREPEILKELREFTQSNFADSAMMLSPEQGQLIRWLLEISSAELALDVGTYTGYSALSMAYALPTQGKVISCDISEPRTQVALEYWKKARLDNKIKLALAPAKNTLDTLIEKGFSNNFDFAFIDADKNNYDCYYEQCLKLLKPFGIIMLDNMLWAGKVVNPSVDDPRTITLHQLNQKIHQDNRVSICMLPMGDGISIIRKK